MNSTQLIINNLKSKYRSLDNYIYDAEKNLLYFNGMSINLNDVNIDKVDEVFFNMPAEELYVFLKQKFYLNIRNEIDEIKNLFENKSQISYAKIKEFNNLIGLRHAWSMKNADYLGANYKTNPNVQIFINELMEGCKIIKQYQNIISNSAPRSNGYVINVDNLQQNNGVENGVDVVQQVNEPAFTLTRNKPGDPGYKYEDEKINSISGYASIVLLVLTSILLATYIVASLIN